MIIDYESKIHEKLVETDHSECNGGMYMLTPFAEFKLCTVTACAIVVFLVLLLWTVPAVTVRNNKRGCWRTKLKHSEGKWRVF